MAGIGKQAKRALRQAAREVRRGIAVRSPEWLRRRLRPAIDQFDLLIGDYGLLRMIYSNKHRLGRNAWRSAQPAPHHIARYAREGVRTIVSLRGDTNGNLWRIEAEACARYGIKLLNFPLGSRAAPTRAQIFAARDLLETVEYPVLIHCKSGADRAGLMSVLYRHFHEGWSIEEARRELSWKFGHVRQADTGILDYFFERYLQASAQTPQTFLEWVETRYDPDELKASFHAKGWANRLVDGVLRRE